MGLYCLSSFFVYAGLSSFFACAGLPSFFCSRKRKKQRKARANRICRLRLEFPVTICQWELMLCGTFKVIVSPSCYAELKKALCSAWAC